ncbi:UNVERIFIED_CONTAM: hypothetical protein K2H54_066665 [Gekko kuhli]
MYSQGCSAVSIKWQQFDVNAPEPTYAPAQIQSLFTSEYLLAYGFISHCTQATLNALIDNQEFQTMVSTTELQKRTGTMLHKLTARALIRDYEQGILHENKAEHEMKKQQLKSLIIKLSLENSIVTQFTSFVAIEKRNVNEDQGADTLNVAELVAKEDVDILPYMEYQVDELSVISASAEPKSIALFGKQPEETLQDFIEKKRRSKKKVYRMPTVQKTLSAISWPQLSELQNQDGYWQLTPELGTLLDLNVNDLVNVSLTKRGIQSLGPKGKEKLLQLIATLLVLQAVRFKQLEGITFKSLLKLNDSPPSGALDAVKKAVEWAKRTHRQFPAICQRLELGKDWDYATKKLLGIEISGTSTHTLANSK